MMCMADAFPQKGCNSIQNVLQPCLHRNVWLDEHSHFTGMKL